MRENRTAAPASCAQGSISRRNLLKFGGTMAAGAAALGVMGCAKTPEPKGGDASGSSANDSSNGTVASASEPKRWSWEEAPAAIEDDQLVDIIEHDFVIVGAGLAGCSTACSLAQNGGDVIVLEKTSTYGARGGHFGSINTKRWVEAIGETDPALVARDWIAQCNSRCKEPLVWEFLNNCAEAMDWCLDLATDRGFTPGMVEATYKGATYHEYYGTYVLRAPEDFKASAKAEESRMNCPEAIGNSAVFVLRDEALVNGASFVYNSPAVQLVKDGDRISAVIAQDEDGYKKYVARKAVILTSGDISGDDEMCERYSPLMLKCERTDYAPLGANTGDGQKMGMWVGAKMEEAPFSPMIHPQGYARLNHFFMIVNTLGKRFMNEGAWSQGKSLAILTTEGNAGHGWTIFDDKWLEEIPQTLEIGGGMFWDSRSHMYGKDWAPKDDENFFAAADEAGWVKKADTIEELADLIAAEEPNFVKADFIAEVEKYNENCRNGKDVDFGKDPGLLFELKNPPFYAGKTGPSRMVCPGGLLVNTDSQVLDADDKPINGLYAVGNVAGGLYGVDYPLVILGNSHGRCITFGYLLGKHLTSK